MQGKAVWDVVTGKVVVVAVKASKDISKNALVWALNHVVQPGDCIKLLVVVPAQASGRSMLIAKAGQIFLGKKAQRLSRFTADCTTAHWKTLSGTMLDQRDDITDSCSQMMFQLHDIYDPERVKIRVKIVSGSPGGMVASEAKNAQSNWVILDK
uniref:Uncharacterized protein n=1 Tax=Rhizophora mucronata TaxID=61149 RepID=A0A2P2J4Y5_RHIMU